MRKTRANPASQKPKPVLDMSSIVTGAQVDQVFEVLTGVPARTCDKVMVEQMGGTVAVLLDYVTNWQRGDAVITPDEEVKPETEAQKRKREEREARSRAKWDARWSRQYRKENEVRESEAFKNGRVQGEDVGLNKQTKE